MKPRTLAKLLISGLLLSTTLSAKSLYTIKIDDSLIRATANKVVVELRSKDGSFVVSRATSSDRH